MTTAQPLWTPTAEQVDRSNLAAFMRSAEKEWGLPTFSDFQALYQWSISEPDCFWRSVWRFCDVRAEHKGQAAVRDFNRMPGAQWFPEARLNFARNLLRYRDDREALVFWNESGAQRRLTYAELYDEVGRVATGLKRTGIGEGDRVAGFMPNMPETVVAMLAAASLGAIWSSCSPDFGLDGVLDRFGQIEPKILFVADGYFYNGRTFDCLERASAIARRISSIETVVVVPYANEQPETSSIRATTRYRDFGSESAGEIEFRSLPFDHPVYILYSSGTTGPPKCIVHRAGGVLLQHLKELVLHNDLGRDDRIFYFTTCGWMMWNWLMSSLAAGATVVLYDGSPFQPSPNRLFDMADEERITIFGTSAKYLAAAEKAGVEPAKTHDLGALKAVLSTGSPLAVDGFDYVYRSVKRDVRLSSISGGTDLVSCFALGNPIGPVYRGEIQTRGLGMKVEVYDGDGGSLSRGKGELVCTAQFPSMPLGFWNDPGDSKYRAAYFETFPGVWHHGDYCELTEHGGMIIWGRSDTVLNPGGVRIGTAEIYRPVEQLNEVLEAVVVGQSWESDVRVLLFVKLREGLTLDETLSAHMRQQIRTHASPRHVPAQILQVADIPRTLNGKIAELAVRNVIENRPVKNRDALANPEALELFRGLPQLQT